jgi:hypothetical protein
LTFTHRASGSDIATKQKPTCSNGNGRHALTYEQRTDALKLRTRQKARAKAEGETRRQVRDPGASDLLKHGRVAEE